uniref:NADH dehydrogenase subunit 6 n=1 Tax=Longicollum sp. (in: thorny-headed worms) TaxID=3073164 RepID=A0AA49K4Y9_9BILA|nr:NADH dehydrogenase subunit 6 [Longicollum sp. (in: thorny-headed worms)]
MCVSSCSFAYSCGASWSGFSGLGANMWMMVSLASVLSAFSHLGWEGWYVLAMVNVWGILVLMVYTKSMDESLDAVFWGDDISCGSRSSHARFSEQGWDGLAERLVYSEEVSPIIVSSWLLLLMDMWICNWSLHGGMEPCVCSAPSVLWIWARLA